jgi:hypothetical protein
VQDRAHYALIKSIWCEYFMLLQIHTKTGVKSVPVLQFAWLIFSQATHKISLIAK